MVLNFEDLGPQIQDLLRLSKKDRSEEELELLKYVSVRELSAIYDMLGRGLDADSVLESIMSRVKKRREQISAQGSSAARDHFQKAIDEQLEKDRELENQRAREARLKAEERARQAAKDNKAQGTMESDDEAPDKDKEVKDLLGEGVKVEEIRRNFQAAAPSKPAMARGAQWDENDTEVWGEGVGSQDKQHRRAAAFRRNKDASELLAKPTNEQKETLERLRSQDVDAGVSPDEVALLAEERVRDLERARRRENDLQAEVAFVRNKGDASQSATLYHGDGKLFANLARRGDVVAEMTPGEQDIAERLAGDYDKKFGYSPEEQLRRKKERIAHLRAAKNRLRRALDADYAAWADRYVRATPDAAMKMEAQRKASDQEAGHVAAECEFRGAERLRHIALAHARKHIPDGPDLAIAREADNIVQLAPSAQTMEMVRTKIYEEGTLGEEEAADRAKQRAAAVTEARKRADERAPTVSSDLLKAHFVASENVVAQMEYEEQRAAEDRAYEMRPPAMANAARLRKDALAMGERRAADADATRKAGADMGAWVYEACLADLLVRGGELTRDSAEARRAAEDKAFGLPAEKAAAAAEGRRLHIDQAYRRYEPSEEELARLADELLALPHSERDAEEERLRRRDINMRDLPYMLARAADRARHIAMAEARRKDEFSSGLKASERQAWQELQRSADINARAPRTLAAADEERRAKDDEVMDFPPDECKARAEQRTAAAEAARTRKGGPAGDLIRRTQTDASDSVRLSRKQQLSAIETQALADAKAMSPDEAKAIKAARQEALEEARRRIPMESALRTQPGADVAKWRAEAIRADTLVMLPEAARKAAEAEMQARDEEVHGYDRERCAAEADLRAQHIKWAQARLGLLGDYLARMPDQRSGQELDRMKTRDEAIGYPAEAVAARDEIRRELLKDGREKAIALGQRWARKSESEREVEEELLRDMDEEMQLPEKECDDRAKHRQQMLDDALKRSKGDDVPRTMTEEGVDAYMEDLLGAERGKSAVEMAAPEELEMARRANELVKMSLPEREAGRAADAVKDAGKGLAPPQLAARLLARAQHEELAAARLADMKEARPRDPTKWLDAHTKADVLVRLPERDRKGAENAWNEHEGEAPDAAEMAVAKPMAADRAAARPWNNHQALWATVMALSPEEARDAEEDRAANTDRLNGLSADAQDEAAALRLKEMDWAVRRVPDENAEPAALKQRPGEWRADARRADELIRMPRDVAAAAEQQLRKEDAAALMTPAQVDARAAERARHLELARVRKDGSGPKGKRLLVDPNDDGEVWGEGIGRREAQEARAVVWLKDLEAESIAAKPLGERDDVLEARRAEDEDALPPKAKLSEREQVLRDHEARIVCVDAAERRSDDRRKAAEDVERVRAGGAVDATGNLGELVYKHKSPTKFANLARRAELVSQLSPDLQDEAERLAAVYDRDVKKLPPDLCDARVAERAAHLRLARTRLEKRLDDDCALFADQAVDMIPDDARSAEAARRALDELLGLPEQEVVHRAAERRRHIDLAGQRAAEATGGQNSAVRAQWRAAARRADNLARSSRAHKDLVGEEEQRVALDEEGGLSPLQAQKRKDERKRHMEAAVRRAKGECGPLEAAMGGSRALAPKHQVWANSVAQLPPDMQKEELRRVHDADERAGLQKNEIERRQEALKAALRQAVLRLNDEAKAEEAPGGAGYGPGEADLNEAAQFRPRAIMADSIVRSTGADRRAAEAAWASIDEQLHPDESEAATLAKDRARHIELAEARLLPTEEDLARLADRMVEMAPDERRALEERMRQADDEKAGPLQAMHRASERARHMEMAIQRKRDRDADKPADEEEYKDFARQADLISHLPDLAQQRELRRARNSDADALPEADVKRRQGLRAAHLEKAMRRHPKYHTAPCATEASRVIRLLPKGQADAEAAAVDRDNNMGMTSAEREGRAAERALAVEQAKRRLPEERREQDDPRGDPATWRAYAVVADALALNLDDGAQKAELARMAADDADVLKLAPEARRKRDQERKAHLDAAKARLARFADRLYRMPEAMRADAERERDKAADEVGKSNEALRDKLEAAYPHYDRLADALARQQARTTAAKDEAGQAEDEARFAADDVAAGYEAPERAWRSEHRLRMVKEAAAEDPSVRAAEEERMVDRHAEDDENDPDKRPYRELLAEIELAKRADEVSALPGEEQANAYRKDLDADAAAAGSPAAAAEMQARRARHLALADARRRYRDEGGLPNGSPEEQKKWRELHIRGDILHALPPAVQKRLEAAMREHGGPDALPPQSWQDAKKGAAVRASWAAGAIAPPTVFTERVCRLPKQQQRDAMERRARDDGNVYLLPPKELQQEATARDAALEQADLRLIDEKKDFAAAPRGTFEEMQYRADAATADWLVRQPPAVQKREEERLTTIDSKVGRNVAARAAQRKEAFEKALRRMGVDAATGRAGGDWGFELTLPQELDLARRADEIMAMEGAEAKAALEGDIQQDAEVPGLSAEKRVALAQHRTRHVDRARARKAACELAEVPEEEQDAWRDAARLADVLLGRPPSEMKEHEVGMQTNGAVPRGWRDHKLAASQRADSIPGALAPTACAGSGLSKLPRSQQDKELQALAKADEVAGLSHAERIAAVKARTAAIEVAALRDEDEAKCLAAKATVAVAAEWRALAARADWLVEQPQAVQAEYEEGCFESDAFFLGVGDGEPTAKQGAQLEANADDRAKHLEMAKARLQRRKGVSGGFALSPEEELAFARRADEIVAMDAPDRAAAVEEDRVADEELMNGHPEAAAAREAHRARHLEMAYARADDCDEVKPLDEDAWKEFARHADVMARAPLSAAKAAEKALQAAGTMPRDYVQQKKLAAARLEGHGGSIAPHAAAANGISRLPRAKQSEELDKLRDADEAAGLTAEEVAGEHRKRVAALDAALKRLDDERKDGSTDPTEEGAQYRGDALTADWLARLPETDQVEHEKVLQARDAMAELEAADAAARKKQRADHLAKARARLGIADKEKERARTGGTGNVYLTPEEEEDYAKRANEIIRLPKEERKAAFEGDIVNDLEAAQSPAEGVMRAMARQRHMDMAMARERDQPGEDDEDEREAAILADIAARLPTAPQRKYEHELRDKGRLPAGWAHKKRAAQQRLKGLAAAPGLDGAPPASGTVRLPLTQQQAEDERAAKSDLAAGFGPKDATKAAVARAAALRQAAARLDDEEAVLKASPAIAASPLATSHLRSDDARADWLVPQTAVVQEEAERALQSNDRDLGYSNDECKQRVEARKAALERARKRAAAANAADHYSMSPQQERAMAEWADDVLAMAPTRQLGEIADTHERDAAAPGVTAPQIAARQAHRARHIAMAESRRKDYDRSGLQGEELAALKEASRACDVLARLPPSVQRAEQEELRTAGVLPEDQLEELVALAAVRLDTMGGSIAVPAAAANGLSRLPAKEQDEMLATLRKRDKERGVTNDEGDGEDSRRRAQIGLAYKRLEDEQADFRARGAQKVPTAAQYRADALKADWLVRQAPTVLDAFEKDEASRDVGRGLASGAQAERAKERLHHLHLARRRLLDDAAGHLRLSPLDELEFARRADEIMLMPEGERRGAMEQDLKADAALPITDTEKIARAGHRARHLKMAGLRKVDENGIQPADAAEWRSGARNGDLHVRLPESQQAKAEQELEHAGLVPVDWEEHKRLARKRLHEQPGLEAAPVIAEAIARMPRAKQQEVEVALATNDEQCGLSPEESRAAAIRRSNALREAERRIDAVEEAVAEMDEEDVPRTREEMEEFQDAQRFVDAVKDLAEDEREKAEEVAQRLDEEAGFTAPEVAKRAKKRKKLVKKSIKKLPQIELTPDQEREFMIRADEIAHAPPEERLGMLESDRAADAAIMGMTPAILAARVLHRARHQAMGDARLQSEVDNVKLKKKLDLDDPTWQAAAREGDLIVRLPESKQDDEIKRLEALGKLPDAANFKVHRKLAEERLRGTPAAAIAANTARAEGLARLPKEERDMMDEEARRRDEGEGLAAGEVAARAAEREACVKAALRRLDDEEYDWKSNKPKDGAAEAQYRVDAAKADWAAVQPAKKQKAFEDGNIAMDEATKLSTEEAAEREGERKAHLERARRRAQIAAAAAIKADEIKRQRKKDETIGFDLNDAEEEEFSLWADGVAAMEPSQQQGAVDASHAKDATMKGITEQELVARNAHRQRHYDAARRRAEECADMELEDEAKDEWMKAARIADVLARTPSTLAMKLEARMRERGEIPVDFEEHKLKALKRLPAAANAIGPFDAAANGICRLPTAAIKALRKQQVEEAKKKGLTEDEVVEHTKGRLRAMDMAKKRKKDEVKDFKEGCPQDVVEYRADALKGDWLARLPKARREEEEATMRVDDDAAGMNDDDQIKRIEDRRRHLILAIARLGGSGGRPVIDLEPLQADFAKRADQLARMHPVMMQRALEEDRQKDVNVSEIEKVARQAERVRHVEAARQRKKDIDDIKKKDEKKAPEERTIKNDKDLKAWERTAALADQIVRMPVSQQQKEEEAMQQQGCLPAAWEKHKEMAAKRLGKNQTRVAQSVADALVRMPKKIRKKELERLEEADRAAGLSPVEVEERKEQRMEDIAAAEVRVKEEKKIAKKTPFKDAAEAAKYRAEQQRADMLVRLPKKRQEEIEADLMEADDKAGLSKEEIKKNVQERRKQVKKALKRLGKTADKIAKNEDKLAEQAEDIAALKPEEQKQVLKTLKKNDVKRTKGDADRAQRAADRQRHVKMAQLRQQDADAKTFENKEEREKFLQQSRAADKVVRMKPKKAESTEQKLRDAGKLPENWESLKKEATKRLEKAPETAVQAAAVEGLARASRAARAGDLLKQRREDEEAELPETVVQQNHIRRRRDLEKALRRLADEEKVIGKRTRLKKHKEGPVTEEKVVDDDRTAIKRLEFQEMAREADEQIELAPEVQERIERTIVEKQREMKVPEAEIKKGVIKRAKHKQLAVERREVAVREAKEEEERVTKAPEQRRVERIVREEAEAVKADARAKVRREKGPQAAEEEFRKEVREIIKNKTIKPAEKTRRVVELGRQRRQARLREVDMEEEEEEVAPEQVQEYQELARAADRFVRMPKSIQKKEVERLIKEKKITTPEQREKWERHVEKAETRAEKDGFADEETSRAAALAELPPAEREVAEMQMREEDEEMGLNTVEVAERAAKRQKALQKALTRRKDIKDEFKKEKKRAAVRKARPQATVEEIEEIVTREIAEEPDYDVDEREVIKKKKRKKRLREEEPGKSEEYYEERVTEMMAEESEEEEEEDGHESEWEEDMIHELIEAADDDVAYENEAADRWEKEEERVLEEMLEQGAADEEVEQATEKIKKRKKKARARAAKETRRTRDMEEMDNFDGEGEAARERMKDIMAHESDEEWEEQARNLLEDLDAPVAESEAEEQMEELDEKKKKKKKKKKKSKEEEAAEAAEEAAEESSGKKKKKKKKVMRRRKKDKGEEEEEEDEWDEEGGLHMEDDAEEARAEEIERYAEEAAERKKARKKKKAKRKKENTEDYDEETKAAADDAGLSPEEFTALMEDLGNEDEVDDEQLREEEKEWREQVTKEETEENDEGYEWEENGDAEKAMREEMEEEVEEEVVEEEEDGVDPAADNRSKEYHMSDDDFQGWAHLRPHFPVTKFNPNASIVALTKQKRVWAIDFYEQMFTNMKHDGEICKQHINSKLLQLEKNIMDPRRLRLMFFDANHSYEIKFPSSDDRARFYECASAVRPAVRVWAPAITAAGATNSTTIIKDSGGAMGGDGEFQSRTARINASKEKSELTKVWVGTWNMSGKPPPPSSRWAELEFWMTRDVYDIYAVCVQEATWRKNERQWYDFVIAYLGDGYMQLATMTLCDLCLIVLCKKKVLLKVTNIEGGTVMTSQQSIVGKKGGVGIAIRYHETQLGFVGCHLPDGQDRSRHRLQMIREIFATLRMHVKDADISNVFHHLFFFGDMGFRLDLPREDAMQMIRDEEYESLFEYDQLTRLLADGALEGFEEAVTSDLIGFRPTWPFAGGGLDEYTDDLNVTPSYADRILVKSQPGQRIETDLYSSSEEVLAADHAPVFGVFDVYTTRPFISVFEKDEDPIMIRFGDFKVHGVPEREEFWMKYAQLSIWCPSADGPVTSKAVKQKTANPHWDASEMPSVMLHTFQRDYLRLQHLCVSVRDKDIRDKAKANRGSAWVNLEEAIDNEGEWVEFEVPLVYLGKQSGVLTGKMKTEPNPFPNPTGLFGKPVGE